MAWIQAIAVKAVGIFNYLHVLSASTCQALWKRNSSTVLSFIPQFYWIVVLELFRAVGH